MGTSHNVSPGTPQWKEAEHQHHKLTCDRQRIKLAFETF